MSNKTTVALERIAKALEPHKRVPEGKEPIVTEPAFVGPLKRTYVEAALTLATYSADYCEFDMDVQAMHIFELR